MQIESSDPWEGDRNGIGSLKRQETLRNGDKGQNGAYLHDHRHYP